MNNGNNEEHALLSPSSAKKYLGCAAALLCESDIPNTSGERALFGTCVHTLSEFALNKYKEKDPVKLEHYAGYYLDENGHGPMHTTGYYLNEVKITDEMVSFAQKYVEWAIPIIDSSVYSEIEMRVNLTPALHPGYKLKGKVVITFGTADIVAVIPRIDGSFMLLVGDLKTGRHKVDAKENWQLMLYAVGVMRKLSRRYNITLIRLATFQPLAGGAAEHDTTPEALHIFLRHANRRSVMALDVYAKGKKALKAMDFTPSASACQWCRFAEKCSAKAKAAVNPLVNDSDLSDDSESHELTPEQLKAEWDKLPALRQHIATIEKAMMSALMSGVKVTGLKLVAGKPGNRAWTNEDEVWEHVDETCLDRNLVTEIKLMSPTQFEKVVGAETLNAEFAKFIQRKPGTPSIAEADDKRPEYTAVSTDDLS